MDHRKLRSLTLTVPTCQEAIPNGNDRFSAIHFQVRAVGFREGNHMLKSEIK